jgi:hypothetical protein
MSLTPSPLLATSIKALTRSLRFALGVDHVLIDLIDLARAAIGTITCYPPYSTSKSTSVCRVVLHPQSATQPRKARLFHPRRGPTVHSLGWHCERKNPQREKGASKGDGAPSPAASALSSRSAIQAHAEPIQPQPPTIPSPPQDSPADSESAPVPAHRTPPG